MPIQDIIKTRRAELDLTMKEVADFVGVSEGTVSRWESGDISNMKRDKIYKLAKILNISPLVILGWDDAEVSDQDTEKAPTLTKKDERDIAKSLEAIMADLEHSGDLMFDGDPMTEEARQSMRNAIELGLKAVKLMNKETYNPNKNKKG